MRRSSLRSRLHYLLSRGVIYSGIFLFLLCLYLYNYIFFASFNFSHKGTVATIVFLGDPQMEGDSRLQRQGFYGWLSLRMNDLYFRHVVDNVIHFISPTHIVVLGDIFSYQWTNDQEFQARVERYNWVFSNLPSDCLLINITGNHDIGYASEVTRHNLQRFERSFGPVNTNYTVAGHILGVLNSLNVDSARDKVLAQDTWLHIDSLSEYSRESGMPIILLTHIPLYKPEGHCTDAPSVQLDNAGYVSEQTMLTENSTSYLLRTLRPRLVFTGHDHYGCIHKHNNQTTEYTIRSVMGDFSGYTGALEIFQGPDGSFDYHFHATSFIIMYAVTALIVALLLWSTFLALSLFTSNSWLLRMIGFTLTVLAAYLVQCLVTMELPAH